MSSFGEVLFPDSRGGVVAAWFVERGKRVRKGDKLAKVGIFLCAPDLSLPETTPHSANGADGGAGTGETSDDNATPELAKLASAVPQSYTVVKAPVSGTVNAIRAPSGTVVPPTRDGQAQTVALCQLKYCEHPMVRDRICLVCGEIVDAASAADGIKLHAQGTQGTKDIVLRGRAIGKIRDTNPPSRCVSSNQSLPCAAADDHALRHHQALRHSRKLQLVLDLDHTLLHATASMSARLLSGPDAFSFTLEESRGRLVPYFVKLRPGLRDFLVRCSSLFQLCVDTQGTRAYARKIVSHIDPDGSFFGNRVVSRSDVDPEVVRSEVEEGKGQRKRLEWMHLNPKDSSMVLIVDDKPGVWDFAKNVITIEPYRFFNDARDVNNASGKGVLGDGGAGGPSTTTAAERGAGARDSDPPESPTGRPGTSSEEPASKPSVCGLPPGVATEESVPYLERVYCVLRDTHEFFYSKGIEHSDARYCLELRRRQTLAGVVVCFTGVFATHDVPERDPLFRTAIRFGARIVKAFGDDVTHLVVHPKRGIGSAKFAAAIKGRRAAIVQPQWLVDCVKQWTRLPERDYALSRFERSAVAVPVKPVPRTLLAREAWASVERALARRGERPRNGASRPLSRQPRDASGHDRSVAESRDRSTPTRMAVKRPREETVPDGRAAELARDDAVLAALEEEAEGLTASAPANEHRGEASSSDSSSWDGDGDDDDDESLGSAEGMFMSDLIERMAREPQ